MEVAWCLSCTFSARTETAGLARLATSELLHAVGVGEVVTEEVVLVVSELVTNAVVHAASAVDFTVRVNDEVVRIEVADRGSGTPERRRTDGATAGGHGLNLVDESSSAWGVEARPDGLTGKVVWAVLPRG